MELDIVAESTDHKILLIGEAKWSERISPKEINASLNQKWLNLPFKKPRKVVKAVFSKVPAGIPHPELKQFGPEEVVTRYA